MKLCKKCGVAYDSSLPCCPKCNSKIPVILKDSEENAPKADKETIKKQWIELLIGIPALILFLYGVIYILKAISEK